MLLVLLRLSLMMMMRKTTTTGSICSEAWEKQQITVTNNKRRSWFVARSAALVHWKEGKENGVCLSLALLFTVFRAWWKCECYNMLKRSIETKPGRMLIFLLSLITSRSLGLVCVSFSSRTVRSLNEREETPREKGKTCVSTSSRCSSNWQSFPRSSMAAEQKKRGLQQAHETCCERACLSSADAIEPNSVARWHDE